MEMDLFFTVNVILLQSLDNLRYTLNAFAYYLLLLVTLAINLLEEYI